MLNLLNIRVINVCKIEKITLVIMFRLLFYRVITNVKYVSSIHLRTEFQIILNIIIMKIIISTNNILLYKLLMFSI